MDGIKVHVYNGLNQPQFSDIIWTWWFILKRKEEEPAPHEQCEAQDDDYVPEVSLTDVALIIDNELCARADL